LGRLALCLVVIATLLAGTPQSAFADASRAVKLENLYRELDAPTFRPPKHKNDDIESAGFRALKQKGDKRLYGLWRVLYAYKSNQIQPQLDQWINRVRRTARAENDAQLLNLADLLDMAYRHENSGFQLFTDADWTRFLTHSGPNIALMAGIERMRTLGQRGTWAEASRYSAGLMTRIEGRGDIARPLLAEAHEVHSYTLAYIGDREGALDHISQAIRLDEHNAFYMRRIERLYDIAYTADQAGELSAAEHFASIHSRMVHAANDQELITWDRYLCARIAGSRRLPAKVLTCLAGSAAQLDEPTERLTGLMLRRRALARAQMGDAAGAKTDLAILDTIPAATFDPDSQVRLLTTAYIAKAEGRSDEAFALLDRWRVEDGKLAAAIQARSASQIASALETELHSKRDESRRLTAEVGLNRSLVRASLLITLLLAALAAGGVAWGFHLRKASTRLREARGRADAANEAKSAFLAVISHELRTPLNGMLGVAQALRGAGLKVRQRELVDLMIDSGDTLLSLLNDFLDLSKIEAGKLEIAPTIGDLASVCARVVNGYQSAAIDKGVALTFTVTGEPPPVLIFDTVRVRQCLTNLVSNALKFTPTGEIAVALCCATDPISGRMGVRLTITDTGIGMSAATLSKLFGAFTQADASITRTFGGTGLGLNITRRLAELMDGQITVASQEGRGATFSLSVLVDAATVETIPAERPVGELTNPLSADEPSSLQGLRVLVVDDHPVNRRVIGLFLQPFDCDLVEAANGREALDALEHSSFDLVLMDVNMPVMDGLEATRLLRRDRRWKDLPVIALTADVMRAQIQTCIAAGMDAHVAKPIDLREMLSTMVRVLAKPVEATPEPDLTLV